MANAIERESAGVALLRRWQEMSVAPGVPQLEEIYARDAMYEDLAMGRVCQGLDELREFWGSWAAALTERRCLSHFIVGDDDRAALFWRSTGRYATHGKPGPEYAVQGVSLVTVCEGKIAHHWDVYDGATFFRQIGRFDDFLAMAGMERRA
ncbi:ester cyclase [Streptomyces wuyuanensis]|uniref:ester cyclase n=1 Tax=Streptomyces wuyuanensis TaxID=1196353 RepID=UPI0034432F24